VVFTTDKSMIFPFKLPSSGVDLDVEKPARALEDHLVSRADRSARVIRKSI